MDTYQVFITSHAHTISPSLVILLVYDTMKSTLVRALVLFSRCAARVFAMDVANVDVDALGRLVAMGFAVEAAADALFR